MDPIVTIYPASGLFPCHGTDRSHPLLGYKTVLVYSDVAARTNTHAKPKWDYGLCQLSAWNLPLASSRLCLEVPV